ncbi:isopentenyl-diphosphate Delta-isomerase [Boseongicola aestuarii]|uniref:Isopentenyl-diphosphate Delta-isomerase n=1 Tax=Boseongicola aestuarii TaxID=1470561 RepID=A0A238J4P1_9RHOB|nr:isopentenyl-diphosphate Delta-isomerase [Boseongicola aestuarii]SMX25291.1 Isopentenyl-diphosphate Delta-isomerase [Boseongicola aestuarii]
MSIETDYSKIGAWVDGELSPVDKLYAHRMGLRHRAVSVFVTRGHETLLQRRALDKYHTPGLWTNTCCTHPLWNEEAETCAVRRLNEEMGITGLVPEFRQTLEYRADVGKGMVEHEVVDIFAAKWRESVHLSPNPEEVADTSWISFDELGHAIKSHPERFTPWLRIYMDDEHRVGVLGC